VCKTTQKSSLSLLHLCIVHWLPCRADHIVSTMAAAESAGVLALGQLWWHGTYVSAPYNTSVALLTEIIRQATWLAKTWNADTRQVLVGVGDQVDPATNTLVAYRDFGTADYALMVGPPPATRPFGQATTLPPSCTYTTAAAPAAEVAAHAAAALALSSHVAINHSASGDVQARDWIMKAQELLSYSISVAPISRPGSGTDAAQRLGVREQHQQLWAAGPVFCPHLSAVLSGERSIHATFVYLLPALILPGKKSCTWCTVLCKGTMSCMRMSIRGNETDRSPRCQHCTCKVGTGYTGFWCMHEPHRGCAMCHAEMRSCVHDDHA
jgi:hypothetical protein